MRVISAYTGPDLLLGVFPTEAAAGVARSEYLDRIAQRDPWAEQAYRDSSPDDVRILADTPGVQVAGGACRVFVVSEWAEGFGQISRKFAAICGSDAEARRVAAEIEAQAETATWPVYANVEEVEVGVLLPDGWFSPFRVIHRGRHPV
jgi:hypothetical protein